MHAQLLFAGIDCIVTLSLLMVEKRESTFFGFVVTGYQRVNDTAF